MKRTAILFSIVLLWFSANGQPFAFGIGDTVPSVILNEVLYHPDSQIKIPNTEKRLTILDFWNTACASCIKAFPEIDSLQRQFSDQISIIPVTWQSREEVQKFWETNSITRNIRLPIATADTVLSRSFGDFLLPCQVWLDEKGVIWAVTDGQYLNASNIEQFLTAGSFDFVTRKKRLDYPFPQPLAAVAAALGQDVGAGISGKFTNHLEKYKSTVRQDYEGQSMRITFINQSILTFYHYALFHWKGKSFVNNTVLEVPNPERFEYDNSLGYVDKWHRENTYCYELYFLPNATDEQKYKQALADLNACFGLWGRIENRDGEVFVISEK